MFDRKRFKSYLALSGKTTKDVAEELGVSEATLFRKMNGSSDFYRNEIQTICNYLEIYNPIEVFFADKLT
ncbi:MAG: helix-turn-helix domain-containing protein [Clostridiaceae bacterium]